MIEDQLRKLEADIANAEALPDAKRRELLALVETLRSEVHSTASARSQPASPSGVGQKLEDSVKGFEASHPQLVQVVNSICQTLSNLGI